MKNFFNLSVGEALPLQRMWSQLMVQSDFAARMASIEEFNGKNRYIKRGISAVPTLFGISFTATFLNQSGALVHVHKDGTVLVSHGGIEMGQGLNTKIAGLAASLLDIPIDAVYISETNTDKVANTTATAASCGTDLNGAAVHAACDQLLERLGPFLKDARAKFNGGAGPSTDAERQEALAKAASAAWLARVNLSANGFYKTPIRGVNFNQKGVNEFDGEPFYYYAAGVCATEVQVDCLTGDVTVLRSDIVHDVGRTTNGAIDIGQVEGAFAQGLGLFLMEEVVFNKKGQLMSKGPGMYKIPGIGDVPHDFRVRLAENVEGGHPRVYGSKAVGEPPVFLGVSALFAVKEAISSARRDFAKETGTTIGADHFRLDAPATAEKVRMACLDSLNPTGKRSEWHARA